MIRRQCDESAEYEVGLPLYNGGTLWLGKPWCGGHAQYLASAANGIRIRAVDGSVTVL